MKSDWLPDYCKPYIKGTGEAYTILKDKRAFICTLKEDGCCNCFSCWDRDTPEGLVEDTWERRVRWITTTLIPDFPSPKLRDLPKVLTPKGIKWAKSFWLKEPDPLEWAHRPWDDWIDPKLARYENRDNHTLEKLVSCTPPDVESVTLPEEAWHMWQRVVLKPDCRKAEAVFRMKCLVLAGVDFTEKDLRAFVEEEEEEPHWQKGVQRNLYRIIEDGGAWVRWKAKAPVPAIQQQGSRASKPRKKKQGPGRGRKRGLYLRRAIVALCMNSGHGPTNTFEMLKDFSEQQEELSTLENEEWPEELHTRSLKLHTIKADYKLIREDPSCANTENLKGKEKDIYSLFKKELG
jgi:hypothetical protein